MGALPISPDRDEEVCWTARIVAVVAWSSSTQFPLKEP